MTKFSPASSTSIRVLLIISIMVTSSYELKARLFMDTKGRTIQAELLDVENETIALKLARTGLTYHIGISELCEEDRAYIAKVLAQKNKVRFEEDVLPILQEKCQ